MGARKQKDAVPDFVRGHRGEAARAAIAIERRRQPAIAASGSRRIDEPYDICAGSRRAVAYVERDCCSVSLARSRNSKGVGKCVCAGKTRGRVVAERTIGADCQVAILQKPWAQVQSCH